MEVQEHFEEVWNQPHTVYRFFDQANVLLWVGITVTSGGRWTQHAQQKPWWPEVANATVEHFPNRSEALVAETTAIQVEHPRYNIQGQRPESQRPMGTSAGKKRYVGAQELVPFMARLDVNVHQALSEKAHSLGWSMGSLVNTILAEKLGVPTTRSLLQRQDRYQEPDLSPLDEAINQLGG